MVAGIIVAASLLGCYVFQKRSDHYLGEAVFFAERYNQMITHMAENDKITIGDAEGKEHTFIKQK